MKKKRSRARLVLDMTFNLMSQYPVAWKASELAAVTGEHVRTIHRALSDMLASGVVEKHYTAYRIATPLVTQIYGAKWYLKQEMDKSLTIRKLKEKEPKK